MNSYLIHLQIFIENQLNAERAKHEAELIRLVNESKVFIIVKVLSSTLKSSISEKAIRELTKRGRQRQPERHLIFHKASSYCFCTLPFIEASNN